MSLQRALALVQEAIEKDTAGESSRALPLYNKAISEMEIALRQEGVDPSTRSSLESKILEYRSRVSQLTSGSSAASIPLPQFPDLPPASPARPSGASCGGSGATATTAVPVLLASQGTEDSKVRAEFSLRPPPTMSGSEAWQTAIDLSERGKAEDAARNFERALELYSTSMNYYLRAVHSDDVLTRDMKSKAREQMKAFLSRAEQLKAYLEYCKANRKEEDADPDSLAAGPPAKSTNLPSSAEAEAQGKCAACGKGMVTSLYALERGWHPQCFIENVKCAFCGQPFSSLDLRFVVGKDNGLPYHVACHDYTTGLSQAAEKTFIGHNGKLFLKVVLQKRLFHVGENAVIEFIFDNETSVKLNSLIVYLAMEEARARRGPDNMRSETLSGRQAWGKVETRLGSQLPMAVGRFSEKFEFLVPHETPVTIVNDFALRREYALKVKAVLGGIWPSFEFSFPVTIQ